MRLKHLVFAVLLIAAAPAFAQETQPGDACTTAGRIQETGGPEQSPGRVLICNGATWKSLDERSNDGKSLFQIGSDAGSCTADKQGRLRYTSSTDIWEYCTGSAWSPFESSSGNCAQIGNVCSADGTVYIGDSPLDGEPMYATRCDHGRTWDGMRCTGAPTDDCWDDCSGDGVDTYLIYTTDPYDGHFNTAALATTIDANATTGGLQNHKAAKHCRDLTVHGYSDWFMPAPSEMSLIAAAHTLIGDIDRTGYPYAHYWTSTETWLAGALIYQFDDVPSQNENLKHYGGSLLRCVRKPAATSGETAPTGCASVGNACSDGSVYAGNHPMLTGVKLYTSTADHSAASVWSSVSVDSGGAYSSYNGDANQRWISHNTTISQYPAAEVCENLTANGHNDWYLPSRYELNLLYTNRVAITGFASDNYWSLTEESTTDARRQSFATGTSSSGAKSGGHHVRCVRKDNFD